MNANKITDHKNKLAEVRRAAEPQFTSRVLPTWLDTLLTLVAEILDNMRELPEVPTPVMAAPVPAQIPVAVEQPQPAPTPVAVAPVISQPSTPIHQPEELPAHAEFHHEQPAAPVPSQPSGVTEHHSEHSKVENDHGAKKSTYESRQRHH